MARRTITVFLRGGLGNQMFQYALGFHLAKKNNAELMLDTTFLNDRFPRREFTYRTFDLDIFAFLFERERVNKGVLRSSESEGGYAWECKPRFTTLSKISEKFPIPGVWLGLDLTFLAAKNIFGIQKIIKEKKDYIFEPEVLSAKGNIVLWGYWQTEKYFADIAPDISKEFSFKEKLSGEAAEIAKKIKNTNSVSIHIRRGDYAKFKNVKKIVGDTDISYYGRAISYIAELVSKPHFFVFSDDIAWCRENVRIPFPATYLDEKTAGPKNAYHLELMSLCKHNIIANSTFSWWGAWLNQNQGKIVVAPKKWYGGGDSDAIDIIPREWEKM